MAAALSDKCERVPPLVNAISFGIGTDVARQRIVDYISSSAAGFYVLGVRLTAITVAKFTYAWCIVAVGMLANVVSTDST